MNAAHRDSEAREPHRAMRSAVSCRSHRDVRCLGANAPSGVEFSRIGRTVRRRRDRRLRGLALDRAVVRTADAGDRQRISVSRGSEVRERRLGIYPPHRHPSTARRFDVKSKKERFETRVIDDSPRKTMERARRIAAEVVTQAPFRQGTVRFPFFDRDGNDGINPLFFARLSYIRVQAAKNTNKEKRGTRNGRR